MKSERTNDASVAAELLMFDLDAGASGGFIVGIDEAGRGPLAGPVVAAAVCFDYSRPVPPVNDSKKLSEKKRETLYSAVTSCAVAWGVGIATHEEIDKINILQATFQAMNRALQSLTIPWSMLLVDGNQRIPHIDHSLQRTIVGGDAKSASIAAASIIAKVTRDRMMEQYHETYPQYEFVSNKGYGTKAHCENIKKFGLSTIHRKTFCNHLVMQTELEF